MANVGNYLYGFTDRDFTPDSRLRGLAGAPVRVVGYGDVAAVVSHHVVERLRPSRSNLEPHHRIVREISSEATLVPAAFGHISESDEDLLRVLRGNHEEIRGELARLDNRSEMGLKLTWNVGNIFEHMVRVCGELREARDRVFSSGPPSMADKLEVGALFESTLERERERLTARLLGAFDALTIEVSTSPPRHEKAICQAALLIERAREREFLDTLARAAALFDANHTLEYSGPWPAYSFVRLRLHAGIPAAV